MAYTYILQCADGTLYTGWTTNLERRVRAHLAGKASRYTRARLPVTLAYHKEYPTSREARQHEAEIRRLSREKKLKLVSSSAS